jgi:hypothetical protein
MSAVNFNDPQAGCKYRKLLLQHSDDEISHLGLHVPGLCPPAYFLNKVPCCRNWICSHPHWKSTETFTQLDMTGRSVFSHWTCIQSWNVEFYFECNPK